MKLFIHSWRMIMGNFADLLRVSWPVLLLLLGQPVLASMGLLHQDTAGGVALNGAGLVYSLMQLIAGVSAAILWHRFVLRDETAENALNFPQFSTQLGYFGRSVLLGLMVGIAVVPLAFLLGGVFSILGLSMGQESGGQIVAIGPGFYLTAAIAAVFALWLIHRLSLILPARALDKEISLGESWKRTAPMNGTILQASMLLVGLYFILVVLSLSALASPGTALILGLVAAAFSWFFTMLGVSLLTTLYGHLVEGRPLNA